MDEEPVNMQTCIEDMSAIFRWMYFNYMLKSQTANVDEFKAGCFDCIEKIVTRLDDKYGDLVEERRKEWQSHNTPIE